MDFFFRPPTDAQGQTARGGLGDYGGPSQGRNSYHYIIFVDIKVEILERTFCGDFM